jgi:hypothetical protein
LAEKLTICGAKRLRRIGKEQKSHVSDAATGVLG